MPEIIAPLAELDALIAALKNEPDDMARRVRQVTDRAAARAAGHAKGTRLYQDRSTLTRSTTGPIPTRVSRDEVRGGFGTDAPYARFVHDGTATNPTPRPWGTQALSFIEGDFRQGLIDAMGETL